MTKKKSSILKFHPKAPKKLVELYRKKFKENCYQLSRYLEINPAHVWGLLKYGKEPKREDLRRKLFLRVPHPRKKQEVPDYIKSWSKLRTEERRKVIQQYITWRKSSGRDNV